MNAPQELSLSEIRKYMLANGCRVTNHALVKHFKHFLTHPETQSERRKQFKEYVNILATIKNENNQKYLILRNKYINECPEESPGTQVILTGNDSDSLLNVAPTSPSSDESSSSLLRRQPPPYKPPPEVASPFFVTCLKQRKLSIEDSNSEINQDVENSQDSISNSCGGNAVISKAKNVESATEPNVFDNKENRLLSNSHDANTTSDEMENIQSKLHIADDTTSENPISVKEATRKFNRLASEEEVKVLSSPNKRKVEKMPVQAKALPEVTMAHPKAKEWIVAMAKCNYQELAKLLHDNPELVKLQDPATNYTALHWAAKHGNEDVVKLIAGTHKFDVNVRTNGGYSPLHIAMQFGRANIFALLCNTYKADRDLLDWAGNKPLDYSKQQTSVSASTFSKIKAKRKPFSVDKDTGFLRIGSLNVRVKKTTEAFSNFLGVGNGSTNHHQYGQPHHRHHHSSYHNGAIMRNHNTREPIMKKPVTKSLARASMSNTIAKYDTTLHKSWSSADNIPQRNISYGSINGNWEDADNNSVSSMIMPPPSKALENNTKRHSKQLKHSMTIGHSGVTDSLRGSVSSTSSAINVKTLGYSSMPTTPNQFRSSLYAKGNGIHVIDSDSDSACGFDSTWSIDNTNTSNNANDSNKY